MTTNDNEGKAGFGAHDQRPQVTLDLKATEVRADPVPGATETNAGEAETADTRATAAIEANVEPETPPHDKPEVAPRKSLFAASNLNEATVQAFATHLTAGLLGALLALIVAYYGAGAFRERLPLLTDRNAQDFQARIAAYDARIAKQEERIAAMEKAASAQRQEFTQSQSRMQLLTDQTGLLKQEVTLLSKRIEDRPSGAASAATPGVSSEAVQQSVDPLKAKLADLEARLGQVSKSQTDVQTDARASALAVALYNLRRAVTDGKPFATELQSIASLSPVPLELDTLNANREKGVRSLQQLQAAFEPAVNKAIDAESRAADTSITGSVWSRMKSLVRVRRVGDVAGDDTQSVLARAEVRLNAGDLRAAVAEAGKLKGEAAKAFKPWLDDAQAKLAVDDTLTRTEAALLTALGTKRGS